MAIASGEVFEMAADPEVEIIETNPDAVTVAEKTLPQEGAWTFPPASVTAMELAARARA